MRGLSSLALIFLNLAAAGCTHFPLPQSPMLATRPWPSQSANPSAATPAFLTQKFSSSGECFVNIAIPVEYETVSERVLIRPATMRTEIIAARFEPGSEQVLVTPASTRVEVTPATFETVNERVLVKPASTLTEPVPPIFETVNERWVIRPESRRVEETPEVLATVTERVLVTPATLESKPCSELATANDHAAGSNGQCRFEVPAVYRDVTRTITTVPATAREIVTPAQYNLVTKTIPVTEATTREVTVPAEYADVTKSVEKTPAMSRVIEVPAVYKTVAAQRLITPTTTRSVTTPAEYDTVSKQVVKVPASVERRQVVCERRLTSTWLASVQAALARAGFNPRRADGVVDQATVDSLRAFQGARKLPVDEVGYLNVATVRALGLSEQ